MPRRSRRYYNGGIGHGKAANSKNKSSKHIGRKRLGNRLMKGYCSEQGQLMGWYWECENEDGDGYCWEGEGSAPHADGNTIAMGMTNCTVVNY